MTTERTEMLKHATLLERHGVRFAWIDPDLVVLEWWTVQDAVDRYNGRDRGLLLDSENWGIQAAAAEGREWKPRRVRDRQAALDDAWHEMRRAAWAMNEVAMHFMCDHTDAELGVFGLMVMEFQRDLRHSISGYIHAAGGDSAGLRKNLAVWCREMHTGEAFELRQKAVN